MDSQQLIKELARREIVSKGILKALEAKLADVSDQPTPRAVAKFLVDKGHLTVAQAKSVLRATLTPEESAILDATPLTADEPEDDMPELPSLSGMHSAQTGSSSGLYNAAMDESAAHQAAKPKSKKKRKKGQSEWDSPLILVGTGGLVMLLLIGGAILFLLGYESADQRLKNAQDAYDNGSYPQAIAEFEEFLEKHPNHDSASLARVRLGTAKIRLATDVQNSFEQAIEIAKEQTDIIEDEAQYKEGQPELAALLPKIATELSLKADQATDSAEMERYIGLTEQAVVLASNSKLIPGRLRDEGLLNDIRSTLERVRMRQTALNDLQDTLQSMKAAAEEGRPRDAYAAHRSFVKQHPELAEDDRISTAIATAAKAELGLVRFVAESTAAETAEPDSPIQSEMAVAAPRVERQTAAQGTAVFRLADGLYGVSATNGQLLWRRSVGSTPVAQTPLLLDQRVYAVDAKREELVCLQQADGKLVWRLSLNDQLGQPTLMGGSILCTGKSGKLHVVDAQTGKQMGYVQFAQPLSSAPAVSPDGKTLYLAGEHSSFYSLSTDDFSCLDVFYLGHAKGRVAVAPVVVNGRVVVVENDGSSSCNLHLLGLSETGAATRRVAQRRVDGLATAAPHTFARRFALVTDLGQIEVFEVAAEDSSALVSLASRSPTRRRRGTRYAAVNQGNLWLAGLGLAKYSIAPTGNRLPVRQIEEPFRNDAFVHPLLVHDGLLIHARKRRGKPGVAIGASDLQSGESLWETDLLPAAAGQPVSRTQNAKELLYATTSGLFELKPSTNRFTANSRPLMTAQQWPMFTRSTATTTGMLLWGETQAVHADLQPGSAAASYSLPGALACDPVPLEEGWITPLKMGQIHWLHPQSGVPLATAYQPSLAPGETVAWRRPVIFDQTFVTAREAAIVAVELVRDQPARLVPIVEVEAAGELRPAGPLAAAGGLAFVARQSGALTALDPTTLETVGQVQLPSAPIWGPFAIGDRVLIGTADRKLSCVYASAPGDLAWQQDLPDQDLAGAPLEHHKTFVLAAGDGTLLPFDLSTGEPLPPISVGQRLASGPSLLGDQISLTAADGALLLLKPL